MIAAMMLAAFQAATPAPPAAPPPAAKERTIVREIIVNDRPADKAASGERVTDGTSSVIRVTVDESKPIRVVPCGDKGVYCTIDDQHAKADTKPGSEPGRREIRVVRTSGSVDDISVSAFSCANGAKVESESLDKDGKKSRVMICAMGDTNVAKAQQLRDAARRIEGDANLSPEARTRIVLAINEAIAKLPVSE